MRASRLISLVLLLQNGGTMTAGELAGRLEVSQRTVYRDVLALNAAGVPVYAEQGRGGGYRLLGGYRTKLNGLSRAEAEALFLSGVPGAVRDMGLGDALAAARLKVLAALPGPIKDASRRAEQRFHLDVPGWWKDAQDPPPLLAELASAVWHDRQVRITYRANLRTVEPYGLVLKHGNWYLVGCVATQLRVYRVDRIEALQATGEPADRDEDFDLPAFWAERAEEFERHVLRERVVIRLSRYGRGILRHAVEATALRDAVHHPEAADGTVVVELPVESVGVAYASLLRLGPEVEVLEPEPLRELMRQAAGRMRELYR